jgi:putative heme-binding domain-containing protein
MKIWILCVGLIFLVTALSAQERSELNAYTSATDVAAGARLFRPLCSTCHGQQGIGWPGFTPNLAGGLTYASSDGEVFDLLQSGIPGTAMPAFRFDERQTWQVVAYLRSLSMNIGDADGDAEAGAAVFRSQGCIRCHRVGDEGGRLAPDLQATAVISSSDALRNAILDPNGQVHPRSFRARAIRADGTLVEGLRMNEDSFSLQILVADGRLISLDKTTLREFEILTESPMPSYRDRLSDKDLDDVIAYVARLAAGDE